MCEEDYLEETKKNQHEKTLTNLTATTLCHSATPLCALCDFVVNYFPPYSHGTPGVYSINSYSSLRVCICGKNASTEPSAFSCPRAW